MKRNAPGDEEVGEYLDFHEIIEKMEKGEVHIDELTWLPETLELRRCIGRRSKTYDFFRELVKPVCILSRKRARRSLNVKPVATKHLTYTHVCLECCKKLVENGDNNHLESWEQALCNVNSSTNAMSHLKNEHRESEAIVELLGTKERKKSTSGALDSGTGETI